MCLDMFGMEVAEDIMMSGGAGAAIGAVLTGYALYVVAKVKHDDAVSEAVNEAKIAGEEYPAWKIEKAGAWYKGYKLALLVDIVLGFLIGVAGMLTLLYMGKVSGTIDSAAAAFIVGIIGGWILDLKIIHPIADNKFMEAVEQPLVDALFQDPESVTQAASVTPSPEMQQLVKKLKDKGLI